MSGYSYILEEFQFMGNGRELFGFASEQLAIMYGMGRAVDLKYQAAVVWEAGEPCPYLENS